MSSWASSLISTKTPPVTKRGGMPYVSFSYFPILSSLLLIHVLSLHFSSVFSLSDFSPASFSSKNKSFSNNSSTPHNFVPARALSDGLNKSAQKNAGVHHSLSVYKAKETTDTISSLPADVSKSVVTKSTNEVNKKDNNESLTVAKPMKILKETIRLDYKPSDYVIEHIDVKFELYDKSTKVSSKLVVYRSGNCTEPCDLKLDGENLDLQKVLIDGKEIFEEFSPSVVNNDNQNAQNGKSDKSFAIDKGYTFDENGEGLIINKKFLPAKPLVKFTVYTEVYIHPIDNTELMGLYKTGKVFCTQCEAEGFRKITYFLDRPDIMATYRVTLEGDKKQCNMLLSNGNLVEKGEVKNDPNRHYAIFVDPFPKPSYLFALVAGDLRSIKDTFTTKSGRKVHIEIVAEEDDVNKLEWAMISIKKAFKWDEDKFNLEYDLDNFYIVCVKDYNMGAMENKGLNVFNTALLLADDKTTDAEYMRIMGVIAHEYFHNWTGNRVTCRDWFQLTLKEGLTVFRDQLFTSDMYSHGQKRIIDVILLKSKQFSEDDGPMSHPIRPESYIVMDNFYTTTVYRKGAEVVRMFMTILGVEGFMKGIKLYFDRHDKSFATCDDFRLDMADANNYDLTQFERWYQQAGTPVVEVVDAQYIPDQKKFKITFSQMTPPTPNQPIKLPLHIPIRIGLIGKNSKKDLIDYNTILHLKEEKQTFEIENVAEDCIPSILRDFSAPVKLKNKFETDEDLAFLMAYDSDDFNKWDASQKFAIKVILERYNSFKKMFDENLKKKLEAGTTGENELKNKRVTESESCDEIDNDFDLYDKFDDELNNLLSVHYKKISPLFIESFKATLLAENQDKTLQAYSLSVPDAETVGNEMKSIDPLLLKKTMDSIKKEIYSELKDEILSKYNELTMNEDYFETLDKKDVARRTLRNSLLQYVTIYKDEDSSNIAFNHYIKAKNATDKLAGLKALSTMHSPAREKALEDFYKFANGDPLALDKWFAIQAEADRGDSFDDIEKLKNHKDFSEVNPNRCRSLYFYFPFNQSNFHRKDGKGYKFLAESILKIDKYNPQIASRMCSFFLGWKKLDDDYKIQMKKYLQMIHQTPGKSGDTFEISEKGLIE